MDLSEQHEKIIKEWAASTRYIQAVRLFGSRARGRAPDSDVDLAVTVGGATPEEARGNYYAEKARWQQELTALLGMQADVELYNESGDDTVRRSCDECSKFLFERPPQTGGFRRPGG